MASYEDRRTETCRATKEQERIGRDRYFNIRTRQMLFGPKPSQLQ